jgi:hypothetical protein
MTQEELEVKAKAIPRDDITILTDDQLFILVAWEMFKDGMPWIAGVPRIAEGFHPLYNTREKCIHVLKICFGY